MGSSYILPKGPLETERLEAQHSLMAMALGANVFAPVHDPRSILSVACGTGVWCREVAYQFPRAQMVGFDYDVTPIRALQVQLGRKHRFPRNYRYLEADALAGFPFPDASFDLVHARFMATWLPLVRWPEVIAEMVRVCRPGGWVQLIEGSLPKSEHAGYTRLCQRVTQLMTARGLDIEAALHLVGSLHAAGCEHLSHRVVQTGETKEQQALLFETTIQGFRNVSGMLRARLSPEEHIAYLHALAAAEVERPHVTRLDVAAWGQKPR